MKRFPTLLLALICAAACRSATPVRWLDAASDSLTIANILNSESAHEATSAAQRVARIAENFIGIPYVAATLEGEKEVLTAGASALDCTTFVDIALAIAVTAQKKGSVEDFLSALENMRYRNGKINGYASRLHYASDRIAENASRGILREITPTLPGAVSETKSLNFMTSHRDLYPALADSVTFAEIITAEKNLRQLSLPLIKTSDISALTLAEVRNGDIVMLTTSMRALDVTHMGIANKDSSGKVRLLHASSAAGKVVLEQSDLINYLRRHPKMTGIRIIRLAE